MAEPILDMYVGARSEGGAGESNGSILDDRSSMCDEVGLDCGSRGAGYMGSRGVLMVYVGSKRRGADG